MSTSPRGRAASRAEARRRARLAARGELAEPEVEDVEPVAGSPRGGVLSRLFPPAPPLPDRPPPLAGFEQEGPLRPIRAALFLLRRNPWAWLPTGLVAAAGYYAIIRFGPEDPLALAGTFVRFGALIAAGWIGWQRPALFGTAAAILGFAAYVAILIGLALLGGEATPFAQAGILLSLVVEGVFQAALGFIAGWYGGYLRRRQAHLSGQRSRQARRR
jgi:hypothetical protein